MATTTKKSSASSKSRSNGTAKKTVSKSSSKSASKKSPLATKSGKEALMELFEHGLKDLYWVEKALTKSIPKMIRKAENEELANALEDHLEVTENQVDKLERIFNAIDKAARAKKCVGMEGILKEGEELMKEFDGPVLDSAIIAAAQKVEHYEMSSYMSLITLADTLDMPKESALLQEILAEEMEADKTLSRIAGTDAHQTAINAKAS
jgi:ferritin-like metal-binding protein YciE